MSSIVQLKRSALSGKVPGTGSLNLGELALNTYDGKIFFRRSGSTDTIQEVVTTNVLNTGSVTITGTLTAESIVGSISASNGIVSGSSQITLSSGIGYSTLATTGSNQFTDSQNITGSLRATGTGSFGSLKVNDTLTINHGEAIISGSALVTNDLTILGAVNARQFNISVISSSVLFESGSSRFGNTSDDTHAFTGSVNVTGSLYLNGIDLSQGNNSGSFSGSFQGDGSGLTGVVSDELPRNGFDYNINDIATINDFNATSSKYLIDFDIDAMIGTPVGHKTYIANFTGSTKVIPAGDSVRFHVRDVEVARIDENGFSGSINFPAGVVSGSSQLTSSYDTRYVVSGSITQTTWDNIASKPAGIISGSSQLTGSYDTRYSLSGSTTSTFIRQIETYTATEGQTIFPTTASVTINNVDVYINGFKLLTSDFNITNANTITLTTGSSVGEQVEINLYSAFAGTYLTSTDLSSLNTTTASLNTSVSNLNTATSSYETKGRGIVSGSSQITPLLPSGIVSGSAQTILNLPTGTISGSIQVLGGTGIISSSAQLENATITNLTITNLTTVNETASVIFSSGSNRFGDFGDDVHSFTGSVKISGSIVTVGNQTMSGSLEFANGSFINMPWESDTRTVWERYFSGTYFQRISSNGTARQLRLESNGAYGNASIVLDGQSNNTTTATITSDKLVATGDVSLTNGNLIFASGKGIDFSATSNGSGTMTSELLDDYETGTWTPSFAGAGTPTHTTQFGRYTKIGNMVYCTIALRATSISGGSTIQITGLPFSAGDASDTGQRATYAPYLGGHINGVTETTARFRVTGNAMDGVKGNGDTTYMTAAQFSSGGSAQITGQFWYYV